MKSYDRHTNPASRIGTARPRRQSQVTRKPPTKRLVIRRKANTEKGYFPNPISQNVEAEIYNLVMAREITERTAEKMLMEYHSAPDQWRGPSIVYDLYNYVTSGKRKKYMTNPAPVTVKFKITQTSNTGKTEIVCYSKTEKSAIALARHFNSQARPGVRFNVLSA